MRFSYWYQDIWMSLWLWPDLELTIIGEICVSQTHLVSSWKGAWLFISTNLNTLYLRSLCAKFSTKFAQWFLRSSLMSLPFFVIISPWKRTWPVIWTLELPSPDNDNDGQCWSFLLINKVWVSYCTLAFLVMRFSYWYQDIWMPPARR